MQKEKVNLKELKAKAKLGQIAFSEIDDTTMTLITALETAVEALERIDSDDGYGMDILDYHKQINDSPLAQTVADKIQIARESLALVNEVVEL